MVVYVGCPLVPGLLGHGDWGALVWFAALPWLLHLVRRVAGLETADPSAAIDDLVDGVADVGMRHRARAAAFATLVLAVTASFVPVTVVLFAAAGVVVAVATLLAGGAWRVTAWMLAGTGLASVLAVALNLPWALRLDVGRPHRRAAGGRVRALGRSRSARSHPTDSGSPCWPLALYVPVLAALAISRAWRLTWSARGAALVIAFGGVLVLADRGVARCRGAAAVTAGRAGRARPRPVRRRSGRWLRRRRARPGVRLAAAGRRPRQHRDRHRPRARRDRDR